MQINSPSGDVQNTTILDTDTSVFRGRDLTVSNGLCFIGGGNQTNVGSQYPHIQLLNPAASGVQILVDLFYYSNNTTGAIDIRHYDTALTTLIMNGRNVDAGGDAGLGEIRRQTNASILGTQWTVQRVLAGVYAKFTMSSPFLLDAGEGIVVVNDVVNTVVWVTFQWREV